jgi:hypothetical protein
MNVILTIDAEVSSRLPGGMGDLPANIDRDIYGRTRAGDFGLEYQLDELQKHGLKAVFFVEPLFAKVAGLDPLRRIVSSIQEKGQRVEAHLHTEWLEHIRCAQLPTLAKRSLKDYSLEEQKTLIREGLECLKRCGVEELQCFRAGNFGADGATLLALQSLGLRFDSSYNQCLLRRECGLGISPPPMQPTQIGSVLEFPVCVFRDGPTHWRPAQLCACSFNEMQTVLLRAWKSGWPCVVLLWHTFELIRRDKSRPGFARPDARVIRRFQQLLEFLALNPDKFTTVDFAQAASNLQAAEPLPSLHTGLHQTTWRMVEQAIRRIS